MATAPPVKQFVVDPNDELVVKVRVTDSRDRGNILCALGTEWVRPSLADLEGARVDGGRFVLVSPESGVGVLMDPAGKLGPGQDTPEGRKAIEAYEEAMRPSLRPSTGMIVDRDETPPPMPPAAGA